MNSLRRFLLKLDERSEDRPPIAVTIGLLVLGIYLVIRSLVLSPELSYSLIILPPGVQSAGVFDPEGKQIAIDPLTEDGVDVSDTRVPHHHDPQERRGPGTSQVGTQMSAPTAIADGAVPSSTPTGEPVSAKNVSEQQTDPVVQQGSWDERIREREPQLEGEQAERLDRKRAAMIATNRRWLRTKENAERREAEADKALREYREEIARGSWGPLEPVLREGYTENSERSFSRRLSAAKKEDEGCEQRHKSGQRRAVDAEPAVNRPLTRTEQLRADYARESRRAFTRSARAERSDVFMRRLSSQLEARYRAGDEGSVTERLKTARMVLAKLGLSPTDLTADEGLRDR